MEIAASAISLNVDIETEPWGERFFQISDPNGIIICRNDLAHPERSRWHVYFDRSQPVGDGNRDLQRQDDDHCARSRNQSIR